jgi:two-component system, NtrC family, sensor histidine kinase HydH
MQRPFLINTRASAFMLVLIVGGLGALIPGTLYVIDRDRAKLFEDFSAARLEQLDGAARAVSEDFKDVINDLDFAVSLVTTVDTDDTQQRLLATLLGAIRPYRAAVVVDQRHGSLAVMDPRKGEPVPKHVMEAMSTMALTAVDSASDGISVSPPIELEPDHFYRILAKVFQARDSAQARHAIALMVDTQFLLSKLYLMTATDPQSQLLVLGPNGTPARMSSKSLTRAVENISQESELPQFAGVVRQMNSGTKGTAVLHQGEAIRLGLDPADAVVAFAPIPVAPGVSWSAATITSMTVLKNHEQSIVWRLGSTAAIAAIMLFAAFGYVLVTSRRAAQLEERLRNADQLAHLREKAEKILESIPTGIMTLSAAGTVTAMNRVLRERLSGLPGHIPLGQAFPKTDTSVARRLGELTARANDTNTAQKMLGERLNLFGQEGTYSIYAIPLEPREPDARSLLVIEDLTDVRKLESQLLRAEKLATVGTLAAGIAHEIGTPLGVVRGRAEYVLGKIPSDSPISASIRTIMEQIDRVTRTIRTLLDFSRERPAAITTVSLRQLVERVCELLLYEAKRRSIRIAVAVEDAIPNIAADPDQLEQVLVNVLMNALDASPAGSTVELLANPGDSEVGRRCVRIEVIDHGCGIADENLHRVFDPFFTTKKRGLGTGLGLTIVAQIVRSHGATIEFDTLVGKGTRVTMHWPAVNIQGEIRHAG